MKKLAGITALVVSMAIFLGGSVNAQPLTASDEGALKWTKLATTDSLFISLGGIDGADTTQWVDTRNFAFPPCSYVEMPLMLLHVFSTTNGGIADSVGVVIHSSPDMSSVSISDTLKFSIGNGVLPVMVCQDLVGPGGGEQPMAVRYQRYVFVDVEAEDDAYFNLSVFPIFYRSR